MDGTKLICFVVILCLSPVSALNILGLFPYEGKSHFYVFEPLLKELASRGHRLTVVSHFPQKEPIKNFRDISLEGKVHNVENGVPMENFNSLSLFQIVVFLINSGSETCRMMLEHEEVQAIWKEKQRFDLVITEQFNSDCSIGLAHHIGAPVVGISSSVIMPWHYNRFGIAYNPSYVPFLLLGGGIKPTFLQRVQRSLMHVYFDVIYKYMQYVDGNVLAEYLGDTPNLEDLSKEIKMMLVYQNFVLTGSRSLPANVKEVGGFHVAKPKALPKDLQKFLDEADHGVIYICFGSMLKPTTLAKEKLDAVLGALAELPQRVIWKSDYQSLALDPKKYYLSNWLPQNDILAHPKVLAFYSHCGLLGTTEAIYHGVPMVAMPFFGDQPSNAAAIEESGLGIQIDIDNLTKESLIKTFERVCTSEFRENVKRVSKAWHDQPMSPMDSALFWTEFAARQQNFTFRSPSADVPLYQYLCLDILAFFSILLFGIVYTTKLIFCSKTIKTVKARKQNQNKSKKE